MNGIVVNQTGQIEIEALPMPTIGPHDALVRIEVCGICNSTDAKLIDGTMSWGPPPPFVLGHESVGVVEQVGERVTSFRVGDRVTRPIYVDPTGKRRGANGGFAEYGIVRDAKAMAADGDSSLLGDYNAQRQLVVPDGLGPIPAALAISLAEVASLIDLVPNLAGKTVLIAGTGIAGLAFAMWAKLAGARTIVLGRRPARLETARNLGADIAIDTSDTDWPAQVLAANDGKVDGLLEATGIVSLSEKLPPLLADGGYALSYAVPPKGEGYDTSKWVNPPVNEHLRYAWVADLLLRGWVRPEWYVTHEWPLSDAETAFAQVRRGEVLKGFVWFTG